MNSLFKCHQGKEKTGTLFAIIGLLAFASLIAGFVIYQFVRVNLLIRGLEVNLYGTVKISEVDKDLLKQLHDIDSYLVYRDNKYLEQFIECAGENQQEIEGVDQVVGPKRKALVIQLLASQQAYTNLMKRVVIPLAQKGDFTGAVVAARYQGGSSLFDHTLNLAQQLRDLRQADALNTVAEMDRQLKVALWSGFAMGIFLLIGGITAGILAKRAEKRFRTLFDCSQDAIMTLNPSTFRLSSGNPAALELFRATGKVEFMGLVLWDMSPERQPDGRLSAEKTTEMIETAIGKGSHFFEWTYRRLDGREFPASVLLTRMEILGQMVVQATVRDITEHKAAAKRINDLNQLYAALAQTNRVIAFGEDEATLFMEVCRIAVELGGMKMSWIGTLEENSGLIKPVDSFGTGTEYLDDIIVSSSAGVPEGCGPTGTAFRENRSVVVQDFLSDEHTRPWHNRALRHGWKASASFPVPRSGKPYAVLAVYYGKAFDQEMLDLLSEMARDLSHALDRFDLETESRIAVESLAESEAFNRRLIEYTHEGVLVWDNEEHITFTNRRAAEIFGYGPKELFGQCIEELLFVEDLAQYRSIITENRQGKSGQFVLRVRHKEGHQIWLIVSATPLSEQAGEYHGGFSMFTDITERKAAEEKIQHLAHFDSLTGLPNRSLLADRVNWAIKTAKGIGKPLALMFLDLDHFKNINDTLGHRIGDELLIRLAERTKLFLREGDTISRLGGDEFILLLPGTDAGEAAPFAEKILQSIAQPCHVKEYELTTTASIGIAIYPTDGNNLDALYRCADIAMYEAKQGGRNSFRLFTPQMQQRSERQLLLVSALRRAVDNGELMLHYQPQVSLKDGKIIGVEALLRWQHLKLGMLSPAEFIPLAEESGLIVPIGEWVLHTAVRQMKTWMQAGLPPMTVAVNLSAIQLRQQNLPQLITKILEDAKLPAEYLELELTESVAMKDPEMAASMMDELHKCGIRMVIDDFGTGYSSLAYLKRFRSYKLKIDQSFVRDIASDPEDEAIVDAVISLAKSLNLRTIAEGVETEQQLHFLREKGCEEVQGYYFCRPLPPDTLLEWMKARTSYAD